MKRALAALVALGTLARADVFEEQFRQYFREEIAPRFGSEESSQQRVVMLRGLKRHDTPSAARWLMNEVIPKDPAADVVRQAVRVLSRYKRPATVEAMAQAWAKLPQSDWQGRALSMLAFGGIRHAAATAAVADGLASRDEHVVVCACRAAGEGGHVALRGDLVKLLRHKHRAVRGAALYGLGAMGGDEALPEVFRAFCSDASDRVRYDAWLALRKLALEGDLPCDPGAWSAWWEQRRDEHADPENNPWGKSFPRLPRDYSVPGRFFGIPVMGERVCFVLDTSGSMNVSWKIDIKAQRALPKEERIPGFFSVKTRWDLVCTYVEQCLDGLSAATELAFVFYNSKLDLYPDRGRYTRNTTKSRARIEAKLDETERGASTALYDGLKAGWGFVRAGNEAHNFNRGCDVLVFLTDGDPEDGEFEKQPDRIRDEVWRVAVPRNLIVHTVGLHNHSFDMLRRIAADTGGQYVHVQQPDDPAEPQDLDFWPAKRRAWEKETKKKWKSKIEDDE